MFQRNKGEYGYISKVKKMDIVKMLIYVAIALAIFVVGLFLNQMSHKNIFTVIAVLFVLPWARIFVEFILLFPYQTPAREDYTKIVPIIKESGIIVISDEIYAELSYEEEFCSIASFDEIKDQCIIINGFSKAFAMTGWRLGYACGPKAIIEQMLKFINILLCQLLLQHNMVH